MRRPQRVNSYERVLKAINFEAPDCIPRFDGFWPEFTTKWRRVKGLDETAQPADYYRIDLAVCVGDESFFPSYAKTVDRSGEYVVQQDGWGRTVRRKEGGFFEETVDSLLQRKANLDRLEFESASLDSRYDSFMRDVEQHRRRDRAVFVKIGGVYIRSSFIRGTENLLLDMVADPTFCRVLFERVGSHLVQIGLEELRRVDAYDTGVWIYDDMASNMGPMFSPTTFESLLLPVYQKLIAKLKDAGCRRVFLHSDGNVMPVLDMLIDAGISGLNPVEPRAGMDVLKLRERYGKALALVGGVCNSVVLPRGDRDEIERHVRPILEAAREGGIVIGSHSIGEDITPETYDFYISLLECYGNYC